MLSADEKNLLADWLLALDADAEQAARAGYLYDLEAAGVRGNVLARVVSGVEQASWQWSRRRDDDPTPRTSVQIVTGFRGSGKTTLLLRAAEILAERGFAVVYTDAASIHDLAHPVTAREFLAMLFALLANHPLAATVWPALRERALELLPLRVGEVQAGINAGPASFGLVFQREHEGEDAKLEKAKRLLADLARAIAARQAKNGKEVVFIVDSLEKFTGGPALLRTVIHSVESVFTRHGPSLRLPDLHCVYTLPPVLAVHGVVPDQFGSSVVVLPSVKVADRSGAASAPGIAALTALLALRVDLPTAFAHDAALRRIIRVSGGHVQDLLTLCRAAFQLQWTNEAALPVTLDTVEQVIREMYERRSPLEAGASALLRSIHEKGTLGELGPDELEVLIGLLDNYMVLAWMNGQRWYGAHPLTLEALDARGPNRSGA